MDVGDIVKVKLDGAFDIEYWRPLCEIKGVIMAIDPIDKSALVRWTEECGLSLHWHINALVLVDSLNDSARQLIVSCRAQPTTEQSMAQG
jgi:hypothetical protein